MRDIALAIGAGLVSAWLAWTFAYHAGQTDGAVTATHGRPLQCVVLAESRTWRSCERLASGDLIVRAVRP